MKFLNKSIQKFLKTSWRSFQSNPFKLSKKTLCGILDGILSGISTATSKVMFIAIPVGSFLTHDFFNESVLKEFLEKLLHESLK